ncbi:MAG: acyltransferase [Flavobacteriales bacterium]|nr:acyltransferase [Flavobacteriales bacterium]
MKKIIEKLVQSRNPKFRFDESVTGTVILSLIWEKSFCMLRGFRLLLWGKKPNNLLLGRGVRFFNLSNISLGRWVKLDDHVYLSALGKRPLTLGDNVGIGAYSRLIISTSFNNIGNYITIGNNVGIGEYAYLGGGGGLEIGDDCIVGQYLSCHPENHNYMNPDFLIRNQGVSRQGIKIGKNCWIGSKVTVLDGVEIGDNCVVAAGSVVTKSMRSNSVIGGVPARVIKSIGLLKKNIA